MSDYRERACTCHPDEAPRPCPQRYAYSECVLAARITQLETALNQIYANWQRGHSINIGPIARNALQTSPKQ